MWTAFIHFDVSNQMRCLWSCTSIRAAQDLIRQNDLSTLDNDNLAAIRGVLVIFPSKARESYGFR